MMISDDTTLLVRPEELKTFLLKQKYPPSLADDTIAKIKALSGPIYSSRMNQFT